MRFPSSPAALATLLSLIFSTQAVAETISGTVLDAAGNPVPGIDIDVDNLGGGGDPDIFNDGTGADGTFTTTIVGAGVYDILFTPPAPPTSTALPIRLRDVLVIGDTDLGVIQLPPGVTVGGVVLNELGLPVTQVNIDVKDALGADQIVTNDRTDLFGNFLVTVPQGSATIELHTQTVPLETLAPRTFELDTQTHVDLGTITLAPGLHVTGTLTHTDGTPLAGVDLDVFDSNTGAKLFTPGDNSSSTGAFDLVVPAGTYDVEWCPSLASRLVAQDVEGLVVTADTPLGTFAGEPGSLLSGTVTYSDGVPAQDVDLDVTRSTGAGVVTCGDDTDAMGFYQVIVPNDTLQVTYRPLGSTSRFERAHRTPDVTGDLVLNVVLPDCGPCGATRGPLPGNRGGQSVDPYLDETLTYGNGVPGTGGIIPRITYSGSQPSITNNRFQLFIEDAVGGGVAFLATALRPDMLPLAGGFILVEPFDPFFTIPLYLGGTPGEAGAGSAEFLPGPIPASLLGIRVYNQFLIQDPGAEFGFALSDAIRFRIRQRP